MFNLLINKSYNLITRQAVTTGKALGGTRSNPRSYYYCSKPKSDRIDCTLLYNATRCVVYSQLSLAYCPVRYSELRTSSTKTRTCTPLHWIGGCTEASSKNKEAVVISGSSSSSTQQNSMQLVRALQHSVY